MQATAMSKKPSFKCPTFAVPAKNKDASLERKTEKEVVEKSSESEEDKVTKDDASPDVTNDAGVDEAADARPDEIDKENTEEHSSDDKKEKEIDTVTDVNESGDAKPREVQSSDAKPKEVQSDDAKPKEVQKKVVKKKPAFSVKQKDGESKGADKSDKPKKEKKPKPLTKEPKDQAEKKHKEPKEPKVPKEKKEKPARVPVSRPTLKKLPQKEPKEKKEKAPKQPPLPVRSLTDEEYQAIFTAAIETVMALDMDVWQPKQTSPAIVKKKKKYSITVGRKPNLDKKLASQNSQESVDEGENTANVEDSVTEKECSKDYGETDKETTEVHDTLDSDHENVDNIAEEKDEADDVLGPAGDTEDVEGGDEMEVDENNNDIAAEHEQRAEQDNESIDIAKQQNETTPEGSEANYGTTPAPVAAPACASPPAKKKKIAGKKKKLEPKSLSFSEKDHEASKTETASKEIKTEKSKALKKIEKKDSSEEKKKTPEKSSFWKQKQKGTPIEEQLRKLKQMVQKLEKETKEPKQLEKDAKEPKKRKMADVDELKKQTKPKEGKKIMEKKAKEVVQEAKTKPVKEVVQKVEKPKPVKKQSKKVSMQKRTVKNEGTWVQCCNSTCLKWRHLPDINDPAEVPERWVCKMNTKEEYNSCAKPEEKYDESEHIYTKFTEGSVVWARIAGWPWWPAMVEMDPDAETFFDTADEQSMVPTHYHVVFFDDKVSRAWIKTDAVKLFTGSEEQDNIRMVQPAKKGAAHTKEINRAKKSAMEALQHSLQERIELFGFATRYHGKWGNIDIYDFDDSKDPSKPKKKRKVTCREDKVSCRESRKTKPKHSSMTTDLLNDDDIESILDNTESLLDNVEEVLDSLDSQLEDSDEDSDFGPEEIAPKKKRKFENSEPEVTAKSTKKSKAQQLESDSENESETDMMVDNAKSDSEEKGAPKSVLMTSDKKPNGGKDSQDKINETVTDNTEVEPQSKDDTDELKNETEPEPQTKDVTERHETKDKIKFDPEIFTMEMDSESQIDSKQESVEDVKTKTEKDTKQLKGKSKEFKAPASKKGKKVKEAYKEELTTKQEPDCDKLNDKDSESIDEKSKGEETDKMKDMESSEKNEDKDNSEIDGCGQFDKKDSEQNQDDKTCEYGKNDQDEINVDKMSDDPDDELDLAPEVCDISPSKETHRNEQAQAKVNDDDSDDDFDLIEKSMYDNDPILDKPREMEHINVTVYHGQDSDSDPFDMMLEE